MIPIMILQELKSQYDSLSPEKGKAFIRSIRSALAEEGISTISIIGVLDGIQKAFRQEGRRLCLLGERMTDQERARIILHGKIAAAQMLLLQKSRSQEGLKESTLLFLTYAAAVVKKDYEYVNRFLDVLSFRIIDTGLDWQALEDAPSLDVLCYKLFRGIRIDDDGYDPFFVEGKGTAECVAGCFQVCSSDVREAENKAFSVSGNGIEVLTRNVREERLKVSDQDDVETLARFAATFIKTQDEYMAALPRMFEYETGDVVDIQFTDVDAGRCVIVDTGKSVKGRIIEDEELVKGTLTKDVIPYLYDGDCIRGAVIAGKEGEDYLFSIREAYQDYALKCAREDERNNAIMVAEVTGIRNDLYDGRITWMTPSGYGGISFVPEGRALKPGDREVMTIYNIQTIGKNIFINLCPPKYDYGDVDKTFSSDNEDVLAAFVSTKEDILSEMSAKTESLETGGDKGTIRMLSSVLASRASRACGLDSYRQILVSLFLSKLIEDKEALDVLLPEEYYIRCCLSFAQGNPVPPEIPYALSGGREPVIRTLSMWDAPVDELMRMTATMAVDTLPWKIGALLLGMKISAQNKDEVSADPDTVRKKICSLLGVDALFRKGAVTRRGKYGKTETHEVEFKSSYVYRNDNGEPDPDYQGRCQVFEAVCGFLNADGGTVYLGVNDDGDPLVAEGAGLNADIEWLRANFKFLNGKRARQLGHAICEVKDLDSYVQFLNSEKELFFKESLLGNIIIEVTDDADAIKITVAPSEYEIAYLYPDKKHAEGEAYVRDGGRTIRMSRVRKEQRMSELKKISKEMGFVVAIQEAIDRQGKLLFKGYASGNSGEVRDRQVVPINLFYNDENVYCYDLGSRTNKQFRLHRISSIEPLPGTYPLQRFAPKKADVFRWLSEDGKTYHIKLRMDVGARNYLLEEYSCAEKLPKEELYEETKDKWILDTHLNGLGAVRRFYLGLADKIEILDTEDSEKLKEEIEEFVKNQIYSE